MSTRAATPRELSLVEWLGFLKVRLQEIKDMERAEHVSETLASRMTDAWFLKALDGDDPEEAPEIVQLFYGERSNPVDKANSVVGRYMRSGK